MRRAIPAGVLLLLTSFASVVPPGRALADDGREAGAKTVRDILWIWGNPEMAKGNDADHTLATFAQASPARRAELLRVPNIVMAGSGVPNDQQLALKQTETIKHAPGIVWEILPDGDADYRDKFEYVRRAEQVKELNAKYPQVEAVLLDDMTSVAISKGFKPEHIRGLRTQLAKDRKPIPIWGVVYTMNFGIKNIADYVNELNTINLWTWHAKDLVNLEENVAHCERTFPGKPIVLGLYLRDYGAASRMPRDLHEKQCATALKLAKAGRIAGIVFLTIDNDPEILAWTADWIARVGHEPLGAK